VAAPQYVPERVEQKYHVVRLYAVLAHAPNMCKDSTSCQLILPASEVGRASDVYMVSFGHSHGVAPKGKWVVVVSARVEGNIDDIAPLALAKRELAAILPLLKPARKMFAEVTPYYEPDASLEQDGVHVFSSCDESSYFDAVEEDVERVLECITGESAVVSLRRS